MSEPTYYLHYSVTKEDLIEISIPYGSALYILEQRDNGELVVVHDVSGYRAVDAHGQAWFLKADWIVQEPNEADDPVDSRAWQ